MIICKNYLILCYEGLRSMIVSQALRKKNNLKMQDFVVRQKEITNTTITEYYFQERNKIYASSIQTRRDGEWN